MEEHGKGDGESPLFLYVSFNAAHAPLQAEQEWLRKCSHIPHHWRRQGGALFMPDLHCMYWLVHLVLKYEISRL